MNKISFFEIIYFTLKLKYTRQTIWKLYKCIRHSNLTLDYDFAIYFVLVERINFFQGFI